MKLAAVWVWLAARGEHQLNSYNLYNVATSKWPFILLLVFKIAKILSNWRALSKFLVNKVWFKKIYIFQKIHKTWKLQKTYVGILSLLCLFLPLDYRNFSHRVFGCMVRYGIPWCTILYGCMVPSLINVFL